MIYQGDKDDVMARLNQAICQIESLNDKDLDYSPFGILGLPITNSNSVYHLFTKLMDIPCCRFLGVLEPGIKKDLTTIS